MVGVISGTNVSRLRHEGEVGGGAGESPSGLRYFYICISIFPFQEVSDGIRITR